MLNAKIGARARYQLDMLARSRGQTLTQAVRILIDAEFRHALDGGEIAAVATGIAETTKP